MEKINEGAGEPVAWLTKSGEVYAAEAFTEDLAVIGWTPLYTASSIQSLREDAERMREALAELKFIGTQLANVAFNLAQQKGEPLTESYCCTLKQLQTQWDDAARKALEGK